MISQWYLLFGLDSLSPAHLHQDRFQLSVMLLQRLADFGYRWSGHFMGHTLSSWRLPVLSEAHGMDCWEMLAAWVVGPR